MVECHVASKYCVTSCLHETFFALHCSLGLLYTPYGLGPRLIRTYSLYDKPLGPACTRAPNYGTWYPYQDRPVISIEDLLKVLKTQ